MNLDIEGKHWIVIGIVIAIGLAVFFYPKSCGRTGTAPGDYKECSCLGIKKQPTTAGGGYITCHGIPTSYRCYHKEYVEQNGTTLTAKKETEVPCN